MIQSVYAHHNVAFGFGSIAVGVILLIVNQIKDFDAKVAAALYVFFGLFFFAGIVLLGVSLS